MTLTEIKRTFEQRKYNLIRTLENGRDDIDLTKQHQIYGAIKELETILRTIDYHQGLQSESEFDFRLSREPQSTLLQKITLKFKGQKN